MKDLDTFMKELLEEFPEVKILMDKRQEKEDRKNKRKQRRLSCLKLFLKQKK